jgi:hypothetical protein
MKNPTPAGSKPNIVIRGVTGQTITLEVDGEVREIANDTDALMAVLAQQDSPHLQVGEKIYNIGDIGQAEFKTIINRYYQESRRSFYLRLFLAVFVPVLAVIIAYLSYRNWVLRQPVVVTVSIVNQTPHPFLPLEKAAVTLVYGDKSETQEVEKEAIFKGIPASYRGKPVTARFQAEGFIPVEKSLVLKENHITLQVRRNDALAKIFGVVKEQGSGIRLEKVTVSIPGAVDVETVTDKDGKFVLAVPFALQRKQQRVRAYKPGYKEWDRFEPVIENEEMIISLTRE